MDSQDQPEKESTIEQPQEVDTTTEQPKGSEVETVEVNGEQVALDELKQGYMRNSDYTKKTQELSVKRKELDGEKTRFVRNEEPKGEVQLDPEIQKAAEVLKQAGFVTKDEIALIEKKQQDDLRLQKLIDANPDLASKEDAIRAIGKSDNRSWEDIISSYGFKETNKILKAKTRNIKGEPASKEPPKQKTIQEMSTEEYAKWKAENTGKSTF